MRDACADLGDDARSVRPESEREVMLDGTTQCAIDDLPVERVQRSGVHPDDDVARIGNGVCQLRNARFRDEIVDDHCPHDSTPPVKTATPATSRPFRPRGLRLTIAAPG